MSATAQRSIVKAVFSRAGPGGVPDGWRIAAPRASLQPVFRVERRNGRSVLCAAGNGRDDCVGFLGRTVTLEGGMTYQLSVSFRMSGDLDANKNLLFAVYAEGFNDGVFRFERASNGGVTGTNRFAFPGEGARPAELRIYLRATDRGKAWIESVALSACPPVARRLVRMGCTAGTGDLDQWRAVLDAAGERGVDIILLPESMNGGTREDLKGPSATLMREKAREHSMHVAGGIYFYDKKLDHLLNRALLYDRKGRLVGCYDKVHPYSPEILDLGVTAGLEVPVFETDFGVVGVMTCYDSWFPDVAELLGLKGAEIILFPNAGYYRSLMAARASDNCVRILTSSLNTNHGIWDTAGRDAQALEGDPTCFAGESRTIDDVVETRVGAVRMLTATLDLSCSPSPHNWGGPMLSAPGGRRNRREQGRLLYDEIGQAVQSRGRRSGD